MSLVWSNSGEPGVENGGVFQGQYQDVLRSLGAWLDARGYALVQLSESGSSFQIEVETGVARGDPEREVLRLDRDALNRLTDASRNDRNRFASIT